MKLLIKTICLLVVFTFSHDKLSAQNEKLQLSFKNYSSKDGLSSATIYDILKDSLGFIWLATDDGLNRFDGSNFKVFRHDPKSNRGLTANHITSLYESKNGRIWIGTNGGGLCYYDRASDSVFKYVAKGVAQVGAAVTAISGDSNGHLLVTCFGGLFIIDPETRELISDKKHIPLTKALYGMVVLSSLEDSQKRVWAGTNMGLYLYEPTKKEVTIFKHIEGDPTSIAGDDIYKIIEDSKGNIWTGGDHGLSLLLKNQTEFKVFNHLSNPSRLSSNVIYALKADTKNRLWIGTEEGLDIMSLSDFSIARHIPNDRDPGSLKSRSIRSIFIDPKGIYWVGNFTGGLHKYDENFNYFNLKEYNPFDPFGLSSPIVTSFASFESKTFVGTDGGGLNLYDRSTGLLKHIDLRIPSDNNRGLSILSLEMAKNGQLWVGTFRHGIFVYNPANNTHTKYTKGEGVKDLTNNDIFCIKEDRNGNVWAGTNGAGINVILKGGNAVEKYVTDNAKPNDPSRPASNYIRCFEEDSSGRMWVGTLGSGISVFAPGSKQFTFYNKTNSNLPSDYIIAILQDSKGNMWVGTSGNGIGLLEKGNTDFQTITEKDGLINGNVHKIIEDNDGNLWISTNKGLSCYNPVSKKFKNYTSNNGLQAGAFMSRSGGKSTDGELFFGGQNGFNHFNPANFKTNKNIPPVVFTGLLIDNQIAEPSKNGAISSPILTADEIKLHYGQSFSISFEALDYTVPAANQYNYKLEGLDKNWVTAGKEHSAYYANIPPGSYTFTVRASNNDGVWNMEGKSVKLVVAPPFWRTPFAYVLYFITALAILLFIRSRGIKKIQHRYEIEKEREAARRMIERERKEAEYLHRMDQTKIKFLTNLSHEFRTPLSLIIGPVENLIRTIKEEHHSNQLNLIQRNSKRLLNLVNQLLDFRKMEENELRLQCVEDDIISFIQDVCSSFDDLARSKKIEFGFYSELKTLPVLFDHDKLERILFNILSNAFKFTPEKGNIVISLDSDPLDDEPDYTLVTVSIKDSGIGMPKHVQEKIFDSFFQHDQSTEILNLGTGIGLAITKEFVQIHGGKIWVDSEVGKGSAFTFQLKLKKGEESLQDPIADNNSDDTFTSGKDISQQVMNAEMPSLLIVEDDDDFRSYIKETLSHNYRIFEASNGKDGWQRALFHHPDIIVCDVQMPVMNGLELVQKLKSDKRTKHIPLILLTAGTARNSPLDGLESGAIDYMTKPFDFAVLQAKIHNILLLNQSLKETYSKQVSVTLPETESVSDKDKFMQKMLAFIYQNLSNPQLSVEILSEHMSISRASLYNRLLDYTGVTPVEFIRSVKLERAKYLLEKTDYPVADIASQTGFANPNYFTKVFKTKFNVTPSEFQSEMKKNTVSPLRAEPSEE
jgi:signal transduction histidine kinase/ligand-binding sensor domain-containing protein/DNA-binding response OmpR family regulator